MKLPLSFYLSTDVVGIARQLLGKLIYTHIDGVITGGIIVETEAYNGTVDRASHAFGNRHTQRTSTMFAGGGRSYVYLCYGIHEMFNVVTAPEGIPHAVLIRAIEPTEGLTTMLERRGMASLKPNITAGPGSVAKALGINRKLNGFSLLSDEIWIEDGDIIIKEEQIKITPRVGVAYAGEDAMLPYRFFVKGNPYVSKPNK